MDFDLKVLHSFCFAQSFLNSPKDGQRLAPVSALTEIQDQPSKGRINNCFGLKRRKESNVYAEGFFRGRTGAWLGSPLIAHSGQIAPTQYIDCSHIESSTYIWIKYIGCDFSDALEFVVVSVLSIFYKFWPLSGTNYLPLQSTFDHFCHFLATFGYFWQLQAIVGNFGFWFGNFGNFWHFLATFGNFKHLLTNFGIFLATFGLSHKILATFMNFLPLQSSYFCYFLAIFDKFLQLLAILDNFWHLLAFHVIMSSSHLITSSSYNFVILSSCPLFTGQSDSL